MVEKKEVKGETQITSAGGRSRIRTYFLRPCLPVCFQKHLPPVTLTICPLSFNYSKPVVYQLIILLCGALGDTLIRGQSGISQGDGRCTEPLASVILWISSESLKTHQMMIQHNLCNFTVPPLLCYSTLVTRRCLGCSLTPSPPA